VTMTLHSIVASATQPAGGRPGGTGILQTQLDRYAIQLADWCSCPDGKTVEGKRTITAIQQKADAVKAQIKQIEDARSRRVDSAVPAAATAQPSRDRASSPEGSRLDVYA
jgi:hypothetical protein